MNLLPAKQTAVVHDKHASEEEDQKIVLCTSSAPLLSSSGQLHLVNKAGKAYLNSDLRVSVPVSGGGPEGEDAEHGEVPANGHGHGASCCQEKPEQLEFAIPLVAVETTIWPREEPR